jgi:hypothetical protein
MANQVTSIKHLPAMLTAPRAIALVFVAWSPWPSKSRDILTDLESNRKVWLPSSSLEFFELWPERDESLNSWYEDMCKSYALRFELHGHGYGPLWWLVRGEVIDCLSKPYGHSLETLQRRSVAIFDSTKATK